MKSEGLNIHQKQTERNKLHALLLHDIRKKKISMCNIIVCNCIYCDMYNDTQKLVTVHRTNGL